MDKIKVNPLDPIVTPFGNINLFSDANSKLWIQQNQLTVALGYNKFLSLNKKRGSGLGKFISTNHAVKKWRNINLLDLEKIANGILPEFLKGFFRELNGQPSRQQFFDNTPNEIFNRTKTVLPILKEVLSVCYDPNSLEAKKGELGELIVVKHLENFGYKVRKPVDTFKSGASIVDFEVLFDEHPVLFAEVKTQIAYPYGVENAMCYSFPTSRIDAYKAYNSKQEVPVRMYIVDPDSGIVYHDDIFALEQSQLIDARQFPFDKHVGAMGGVCHYWHRDQFTNSFEIEPVDLANLRVLFGIDTPDTNTPAAEPLSEPKAAVEKLASFAGIAKNDLIHAILDIKTKKFEREQIQIKELLA